jgi:UDP-N-acetylmuramoyl-tripeptide--D-alanyl-D-alanine ligase
MSWTLAEVAAATGAHIVCGDPSISVASVSTDSRTLAPGALFFALRGPTFDGHTFAAEAVARGACGVVAAADLARLDAPVLRVANTARALGDLAAYTRRRAGLWVFALTGSNGKTTTKEMLAAICEQRWPRRVLKTQGNLNNLIGLPLTLLSWRDETVAVLEMGMNRPGEIARLTEIAAPNCGAVLNVGAAHLEGLGSLAAVAAAKGELFAGLPAGAVAVVNAEDEWVGKVACAFKGRTVPYGAGTEICAERVVDLGIEGIAFTLRCHGQRASVRLHVPGRHNVANAVAAAAMAWAGGISLAHITGGLEAARGVAMRMEIRRLGNGVTIVNDAYNANPGSMETALRALVSLPGRPLAVLGEMRELGAESVEAHRQLGERTASLGVDLLVVVGEVAGVVASGAHAAGMRPDSVVVCRTHAEAVDAVRAHWRAGDVVLIKGSRGARLEQVAARLEEAGNCR